MYKNKYCVLSIVPWENGKRKGEKTIQNLHFFYGKNKKRAKSEKREDFMQVFLFCAVCINTENEKNSVVDR